MRNRTGPGGPPSDRHEGKTAMRKGMLVLLAMLSLPAADLARADPAGSSTSLATVGVREVPRIDSLGDRVGRLIYTALDFVGLGETGFARMIFDPVEIERRNNDITEDFARLMDIAGYKLKEIENSVALIPKIVLSFGQARQLTEGDRNFLERQLRRHELRQPGPVAAIERAIVRAVADASELGGFQVGKLKVNVLPLPKVRFELVPNGSPLGYEAARLMRALDRVNAMLNEIDPDHVVARLDEAAERE